MLSKLKLLAKDTVIYGTSTILARSLNYLLVPLYANYLTTFDNGVQTLIYANIAIANVVFSYGLETSYLKSASDAQQKGTDPGRYFSTAFFSLLLTSTLFAAAIVLFSPDIASLIGLSEKEFPFVRYTAVILWIDTLLVIPFAELRLKRKAVQFAIARVAGVAAVVASSVILVIPFRTGLHGAFIANIIGSLVSLVMVIPVFGQIRFFFSIRQLREMLAIGLPYVPTGIAGLLIHLIDRNILIRISREDIARIYGPGFEPSDIVGIYGRMAAFGIILQLLIQVFRFAWQPFFLQHASDPDAKRLFSRVFTISSWVTIAAALASTLFIPDLIRIHFAGRFYILPPRYWIGFSILPWIFFSYVFDMMSTNLSAGMLVTGNTRYLPIVTFAGAAVTSVSCMWLVPFSGMDGAAVAILAGTFIMFAAMAYFALRVYPNSYDWLKLFCILAAALFLAGISAASAMPFSGQDGRALLLKGLLMLAFSVLSVMVFRREASTLLNQILGKRSMNNISDTQS
jgi:O-antigen/teichoic acid export membrane protein